MVTSNPLLAHARGGLGKIVVFKQMYGKTVMTNYPRKANIPWEKQSPAQRTTRDNFRNAAAFAKAILKDPTQKAYYEKKKKQLGLYSAYQAAIAGYMRKLTLESVNRKKYTGKAGGQIAMTIRKKDFGTTAVKVTPLSARSGQVIESGIPNPQPPIPKIPLLTSAHSTLAPSHRPAAPSYSSDRV